MDIVANRLRGLREGIKVSQTKIAKLLNTTQTSIGRYETDMADPPYEILLWYADYFDVSLDYIFGRTDNPQGKAFDYKPEALKAQIEHSKELTDFVEMCFDPGSPMNDRLKKALLRTLEEVKDE